jgi:hypothetical protein
MAAGHPGCHENESRDQETRALPLLITWESILNTN